MGDSQVISKRKDTRLYFFVGLLHVFGLERGPTVDQSVHNDSETPNIHLVAVAFGLQNLGRDIIWCSANGPSLFAGEGNLGRKSKISHFDVHIFIEK